MRIFLFCNLKLLFCVIVSYLINFVCGTVVPRNTKIIFDFSIIELCGGKSVGILLFNWIVIPEFDVSRTGILEKRLYLKNQQNFANVTSFQRSIDSVSSIGNSCKKVYLVLKYACNQLK